MNDYARLASPYIPPAQISRRDELLDFLRTQESGITAAEAVEWSIVYRYLQGRQEKCAQDMRALEKVGLVARTEGRNPYWRAIVAAKEKNA